MTPELPDLYNDDAAFAAIYEELRRMARQAMANEFPGQTLQPTALVHEAFFRLSRDGRLTGKYESRAHFFGAAANTMRQILVEAARRKATLKRGGAGSRIDIPPEEIAAPERADELLVLDEALVRLKAQDAIVAELVNLRYFGGLTIKECAEALGISPRTADSYWAYAKAWLTTEIRKSQN